MGGSEEKAVEGKEEEKAILFAPIGNPEIYKKARYVVPGKCNESPGGCADDKNDGIESTTTILPLCIYEKVNRVVVFPSLTLLTRDDIELAEGTKEYPYNELSNKVEGSLKKIKNKDFINDLNKCEERSVKLKIYTVPGIGSFGKGRGKKDSKGEKESSPNNTPYTVTCSEETKGKGFTINLYPAYIYWKAYEELSDLGMGKNLKVIIDLTHGVNYMPFLAYQSIALASMLYSAINKAKVKLIVYNSDPFVEGMKLNINRVAKINIGSQEAFGKIIEGVVDIDDNSLGTIIGSIKRGKGGSNSCKFDSREIKKLARASSVCVFLLAFHMKDEIEGCANSFEDRLKGIEGMKVGVEVKREDIKVKYKCDVHYEEIMLHAMFKILSKISGGDCGSNSPALSDNKLEGLAKSYCDEAKGIIIINEIDRIRGSLKNAQNYEYTLLSKIMEDKDTKSKGKSAGGTDKRNLIAHGGLEENVTYIKAKGYKEGKGQEKGEVSFCAKYNEEKVKSILDQF